MNDLVTVYDTIVVLVVSSRLVGPFATANFDISVAATGHFGDVIAFATTALNVAIVASSKADGIIPERICLTKISTKKSVPANAGPGVFKACGVGTFDGALEADAATDGAIKTYIKTHRPIGHMIRLAMIIYAFSKDDVRSPYSVDTIR